jgi:hypothetical protein
MSIMVVVVMPCAHAAGKMQMRTAETFAATPLLELLTKLLLLVAAP